MLSKIHLLEKYLPEYFLSEMLAHEKALFLGCQHPQSIYSLCANLVLMLYEEYTLSADQSLLSIMEDNFILPFEALKDHNVPVCGAICLHFKALLKQHDLLAVQLFLRLGLAYLRCAFKVQTYDYNEELLRELEIIYQYLKATISLNCPNQSFPCIMESLINCYLRMPLPDKYEIFLRKFMDGANFSYSLVTSIESKILDKLNERDALRQKSLLEGKTLEVCRSACEAVWKDRIGERKKKKIKVRMQKFLNKQDNSVGDVTPTNCQQRSTAHVLDSRIQKQMTEMRRQQKIKKDVERTIYLKEKKLFVPRRCKGSSFELTTGFFSEQLFFDSNKKTQKKGKNDFDDEESFLAEQTPKPKNRTKVHLVNDLERNNTHVKHVNDYD